MNVSPPPIFSLFMLMFAYIFYDSSWNYKLLLFPFIYFSVHYISHIIIDSHTFYFFILLFVYMFFLSDNLFYSYREQWENLSRCFHRHFWRALYFNTKRVSFIILSEQSVFLCEYIKASRICTKRKLWVIGYRDGQQQWQNDLHSLIFQPTLIW